MAQREDTDTATLDVIAVIGTSGLGKSTTIKSFCQSEAIITSSAAAACTKKPEICIESICDDEKNETQRIWVDTMGAEDSAAELKDEDILRSIMQMLIDYVLKLSNKVQLRLKILWFVARQMKATPALQTQANFIRHFDEGSGKDAWNSTCIVLNKGILQPAQCKDIQGALAVAHKHGAPWQGQVDAAANKLGSVQCIGYTRVDCLDEDDLILEEYNHPEYPQHMKRKKGWLSEAEMMTEINMLLQRLPFLSVSINKQKCEKCGVVGDERWVNVLCHGQPNKIHPEVDKLIHTEDTIKVHRVDGTESFHYGEIINYHSGSLEKVKVGGKYHTGTYSTRTGTFCPFCDQSIGSHRETLNKGSFKCNRCKTRVTKYGVIYYCTKCPPNNFGFTTTGQSGTHVVCIDVHVAADSNQSFVDCCVCVLGTDSYSDHVSKRQQSWNKRSVDYVGFDVVCASVFVSKHVL